MQTDNTIGLTQQENTQSLPLFSKYSQIPLCGGKGPKSTDFCL